MIKFDSSIGYDYTGIIENNIKRLNEVFVGVNLTPEEETSLKWLAGWSPSTVNNIISAFQKIEEE